MSNDNLILFPKKSNSSISMSDKEIKWMISGTLALMLVLSVGINSTLLSARGGESKMTRTHDRGIASIEPIVKVSWENRAFEVLDQSDERDLASIGQNPSLYDQLAFGTLEGKYTLRMEEGFVRQAEFSASTENKPTRIKDSASFVKRHLALFGKQVASAQKVHEETNGQLQIERFRLTDSSGQDQGLIQLIKDDANRLISMTVQ
ncbi:MAG: hypothetical protein KDD33_04310 [Bdellovibrionales bacterium]|nr:hypothetical protein [Bdellovibrionales bacterium]